MVGEHLRRLRVHVQDEAGQALRGGEPSVLLCGVYGGDEADLGLCGGGCDHARGRVEAECEGGREALRFQQVRQLRPGLSVRAHIVAGRST